VGLGAVGRRVEVDATGDDQAIDAVQEVVGLGYELGLGGHHQRQATGAADRFDVAAGRTADRWFQTP